MKKASVCALAWALSACTPVPPALVTAPPALASSAVSLETLPIRAGYAFELQLKQSAYLAEEKLNVQFEALLSDSRCPTGQICSWAGEAEMLLKIEFEEGKPQELRLKLGPDESSTFVTIGPPEFPVLPSDPQGVRQRVTWPKRAYYQLRVQALTPYPESEGAVLPASPRLTLILESR
ncbi:MAG: hypothetical protein ACO1RX_08775 [Candidatus Sericytochromatia bacterium]